MKQQETIQNKSDLSENFSEIPPAGYKRCPYCGQGRIPFKRGVCLACGKQVAKIVYVDNAKTYVKNWYEYVGRSPKKVDRLGIKELMDN